MQVVFVHGVNNRDGADGAYAQEVAARTDRLNRLAFGGMATIRNPYWGGFGRPERGLESVPKARSGAQALGLEPGSSSSIGPLFDPGGLDLQEIVGTLSIGALQKATKLRREGERHEIEDFWMAAASFAEMRPHPSWLAQSATLDEILARINAEVEVMQNMRSLGQRWQAGKSSINDFAAARLRNWSSGFLAQFLGDAFMFFSRREAGRSVRREITASILDAARSAEAESQPVVLIGHSMGGSILHDMLTDPGEIRAIEADLGRPLEIDLFLSVGTQIGLFSELGQFASPGRDRPLLVQCANYWNIFDFADTLSFLCEPSLAGVVDLEVNTASGVLRAHNAYFDNTVFFTRLHARLKGAGLVA